MFKKLDKGRTSADTVDIKNDPNQPSRDKNYSEKKHTVVGTKNRIDLA